MALTGLDTNLNLIIIFINCRANITVNIKRLMMPNFKRIKTLFLIFTLIGAGCSNRQSAESDGNLDLVCQSAKKNQEEIRKVIRHYSSDPLKSKAVRFLIANMVDQYHYEGKGIGQMNHTFLIMDSLLRSGHGIFDKSWDSIQAIHPPPGMETVKPVRDIETLRSDFLIKNIDLAFNTWHYPWARGLSFEEFCEYILPYKVTNETPDDWRQKYQERYAYLLKSHQTLDAKAVCLLINKDLKKWFYVNAKFGCRWNVNSSDLEKTHTGKCSEATQLAAYAMRAMGLPVTMDFCPFWGNKNLGHEWDALMYHGKMLHFVGSESDPGKVKLEFTREYWIKRKMPKVFRHTYAIQSNSLATIANSLNNIPPLFQDRHIVDVTEKYAATGDIILWLNGDVAGAAYAYLTVFSRANWQPVFWSKINFFNRVKFTNMGKGIVYLPVYYQHDETVPAGDAFFYNKEGVIEKLIPDLSRHVKIIIDAKYPEGKSNKIIAGENYELFYWNKAWLSLGRHKATGNTLTYSNVPSGALLWVRNVDKGVDERIFIYKDNKQLWL